MSDIDWRKFEKRVPIGTQVIGAHQLGIWDVPYTGDVFEIKGEIGVLLKYPRLALGEDEIEVVNGVWSMTCGGEENLAIQFFNHHRLDDIEARWLSYLVDGQWKTFDEVMAS